MTNVTCAHCGARLTPWDGRCPSCGQPFSASVDGSAEADAREAVHARVAEAAGTEYEVVRELGRGGMGWVFLGRDKKLGRLAALKVLPALDAMRPASVERFRREAETAARLSHPNIVAVYGAGGDMATPYFAMAYIEGESLAGRIAQAGALPVSEALRIAREVGGALSYAHRQGVVHRDVKPQNILLEREGGRALVADFGVARAAAAERMTLSGVSIGTPGYMAPEQAAGASDVDARADVYALGAVLFEMVTGKRLESFETGEWPISSASARRAAQRTKPELPGGLVDAIARAVAPRREDRWLSVEAMLAALEPFGATGVRPAAPRRRLVRWYVAGSLIAVVAALSFGVPALFRNAQRPQRDPASPRGIAVMRFDGDTAAADTLLKMLRYQLGGFSTVRVADRRVFTPVGGDPAAEDVRAAARKAGATWILHGLVVRAGDLRVRAVSAETTLVVDLGRVAASGMADAADSIVLLLSRSALARDLGLVPGRGAVPFSPAAARVFYAAEEAFRRADYRSAVADYDTVIALDPTFALARYKRFLAALQQEPTEERLREAVDAVRGLVARVGPQESKLLSAYLTLFDRGDVVAAEAELERLVAEDSTFLDGWFALGEVRYHYGALAGRRPEAASAAFLRALALWPDAAPALMHLVGLDLWLGNRSEAREHIGRYLAQDSTSPIGRMITLARSTLFGSLGERLAALRRLGEMDDQVLEIGALAGVQTATDNAELRSAQRALEEMTRAGRSPRVRSEGARFLVASFVAQGRWSEAGRRLDDLRSRLPGDRELERWPAVAFLAGFGSAEAATGAAAARLQAAWTEPGERAADLWLAGAVAVEAGDAVMAHTLLGELDSLALGATRPSVIGMHAALRGRIHEAEGRTTRAAVEYEIALANIDAVRAPFTLLHSAWLPRYRLARYRLARGDSVAALSLLLAQDFLAGFGDQVVRGPVWLLHGRVLAAHGDVVLATRYFGRAYDLLRYAEPPLDAVRDSALAELTRLGARR